MSSQEKLNHCKTKFMQGGGKKNLLMNNSKTRQKFKFVCNFWISFKNSIYVFSLLITKIHLYITSKLLYLIFKSLGSKHENRKIFFKVFLIPNTMSPSIPASVQYPTHITHRCTPTYKDTGPSLKGINYYGNYCH